MGNLFSISGILTAVTSIVLVSIILKSGRGSKVCFVWALFNISVATWGIGAFFIGRSSMPDIALSWWKFAHLGIIFIPVFIFHTISIICESKRKKLIVFVYGQGIIFGILDVMNPDLCFLTGVRHAFSSLYYGTLGILYHPFFVLWILIVAFAHYQLYCSYKQAEGRKRVQMLYLLSTTLLGFVGGGTNFITAYKFNIFPFGNFAIPIYSIIVTYAVLKYRLLDISIAYTRTGIFIAVYSLVLGIPFAIAFGWQEQLAQIIGSNWWMVPLVTMTVLATAGPYIYLYIQKRAEAKLLQEQRQYQATLRRASLGMGRIKDLKRLLDLIVHVVTRTVRIEHCEIYLFHETSKQFVLKASKSNKPNEPLISILEPDSVLIKYLNASKEPLVYEEVSQHNQDYIDQNFNLLEQELRGLDAALALPSFIEQKLIALIVLGKKRSNKLYSHDDLVVFSILANQSALAIENAQFYEDMRSTHEQLIKAEKMATVGTMADGLSHQINNRLHAMGFIAGDALDTIKIKKSKKKIPDEAKEWVEEIEHSLNRIQDNVKRGGEIVEGLLKYTRKGEEGFSPIDLDQLLSATIEMVRYKIKLEQMDIIRNFDHQIPKIHGNFTQLQEVFFNIIDNSYDAIMQRVSDLKEKDFKGQLEVSTNRKGKNLEIVIRDNGIGVKREDAEKLFTPFFTTKLSSRKGTGLGLYVIRQIIEENHKGKVRFESEYKNGSITKILLPIAIQ